MKHQTIVYELETVIENLKILNLAISGYTYESKEINPETFAVMLKAPINDITKKLESITTFINNN